LPVGFIKESNPPHWELILLKITNRVEKTSTNQQKKSRRFPTLRIYSAGI